MSSKLQRAQQNWERGAALLRCPVCAEPMDMEGGRICCEKGHSYDIARKGYVNFAQAAGGRQYGKELFESRRAVFAAGCFDLVADAAWKIMNRFAPDGGDVLDAGCGEGYYTARLAEQARGRFFGVDLCREAVAMATDYDAQVCWCVADLARLPMGAGTMDAVLNILSPANYGEFFRVLKPGGIIIKVAPGGGYLREVRGLAGAAPYSGAETEGHIRQMATVEDETKLQYKCSAAGELAAHFFRMTPLTAGAKIPPLAGLDEVTVDLNVFTLRTGRGRTSQAE